MSPGSHPCPATLVLPDDEPGFGPWESLSAAAFARRVTQGIRLSNGRTAVIAIDGRSGGGKTTAAALLRSELESSVVVHTDDIAWNHSFFGWADLAADHVLGPARRGEAVSYRPPGWVEHNRDGAIDVPGTTEWLVVEGVGAARRELGSLVDAVVWVQSDFAVARERGILRDGGHEAAEIFWDEWMAEENPFLAGQRPWERADIIVNGTPPAEVAAGRVLVAPPFRHSA